MHSLVSAPDERTFSQALMAMQAFLTDIGRKIRSERELYLFASGLKLAHAWHALKDQELHRALAHMAMVDRLTAKPAYLAHPEATPATLHDAADQLDSAIKKVWSGLRSDRERTLFTLAWQLTDSEEHAANGRIPESAASLRRVYELNRSVTP